MSKMEEADQIIMKHVIWSLGAGLIPLPLFDITAVTAIQVDMLTQLGNLFGTDITKSAGKTLVSALAGSTAAKLGASVFKALPGIGTIIGGVSMSVMSGASTYAVGQVAISYLEENGELIGIDMKWAKKAYDEAFEKGKKSGIRFTRQN